MLHMEELPACWITVKIAVPSDFLGVVAYFYNEVRGALEMVDCEFDSDTGLVTIFTDHNTPYVVQVLTAEDPDPVVPVDPEEPNEPDRPIIVPDDDDYVPPIYVPSDTSSSDDDTVKIVACAAVAVVAAIMAAFLILGHRRE